MMWWPNGGGWGGWIFMIVTMVLVWGGFIALIVWAVRSSSGGGSREGGSPQERPDPQTILEERFARGEITADELEAGRRALVRRS
jgi:putative membrane protein